MIIPACFTYFQASRDGFRTKSTRTHSKTDVRFCSITEPNRTIGVRLGFGSILRRRVYVPRNPQNLFSFVKIMKRTNQGAGYLC